MNPFSVTQSNDSEQFLIHMDMGELNHINKHISYDLAFLIHEYWNNSIDEIIKLPTRKKIIIGKTNTLIIALSVY